MKEPAVLNGRNCVHHDFGNIVILHDAALGTLLAVEESGNELGLEVVGGKSVAVVAERGYLLDLALVDANERALRVVIRLLSRLDLNSIRHRAIGTKLGLALFAGFGISGMAQVIADFFGIGFLADPEAAWLSEDLGCIGEDLTAHALVYDFLVLDVVIGKHTEANGEHDKAAGDKNPHKRTLEALLQPFKAREF